MAAPVLFFAVSIGLLLINTSASKDQVVKFEFRYGGESGPEKWGSLNPAFSACSHGKLQSPINIVERETIPIKKPKPLNRVYLPANSTLVDAGFNVGIHCEGYAGKMVIDGKTYFLKQVHWHSPSEHRINGLQYAAELHLVHSATDGNLSVVAVLYKYGHANPILAQMNSKFNVLGKMARKDYEEAEIPIGIFNYQNLVKHNHYYYRYKGSLTTPPCSENVIWIIHRKVGSISREQVRELENPLVSGCKRNCRPIQPLNGRQVERYQHLPHARRPN